MNLEYLKRHVEHYAATCITYFVSRKFYYVWQMTHKLSLHCGVGKSPESMAEEQGPSHYCRVVPIGFKFVRRHQGPIGSGNLIRSCFLSEFHFLRFTLSWKCPQ